MSEPDPAATVSPTKAQIAGLLRQLAPQALAALTRRHGRFDACEDAMQEGLLAAFAQWANDGIPDNPRAWLITVATRRLIDEVRSESARRRRQQTAAALAGLHPDAAAPEHVSGADDSLTLLFLCCHPTLTAASQVALTLRAMGGLTTAQIAAAFLVPEATMGSRISRAKQQIRAAGARFELPPDPERAQRLAVVQHVLYLMFNEGYIATSGDALAHPDLATEAIRLTRQLHRLLPTDGETAGLLALMVLTDARRDARVDPNGDLVPLAEQDRSQWDSSAMAEGNALLTGVFGHATLGPYQLQAAIAAVHDAATDAQDTDWRQITGLYAVLDRIAPNPVITLNRAVAVAMLDGPAAGLAMLEGIEDSSLAERHRLPAVRAHLYEQSADIGAARRNYLLAAQRTSSTPERLYLTAKARGLTN